MNDYDKAFAIVQARFYRDSLLSNKIIKSFKIDCDKCLRAQFEDGFIYAIDEDKHFIFEESRDEQALSRKDAIEILVKVARETSIFLGRYSQIKILSKGETLEELAIAYDTSLSCLEI